MSYTWKRNTSSGEVVGSGGEALAIGFTTIPAPSTIVRTRYSFSVAGGSILVNPPWLIEPIRATVYVGYDPLSGHSSEDFDPYVNDTFDFMVTDNLSPEWTLTGANDGAGYYLIASKSMDHMESSSAQRVLASFQPRPFAGVHIESPGSVSGEPITWWFNWQVDLLYKIE